MQKFINRLKSKLFLKVFLSFTALMVALLLLVSIITSNSTSNILIQRELLSLHIVLVDINNYVEERTNNIHKEVFTLNLLSLNGNSDTKKAFNFLETDYRQTNDVSKYIDEYGAFVNSMNSAFSADRDIVALTVYKPADHTLYKFYKGAALEVVNLAEPDPAYEAQITNPSQNLSVSGFTFNRTINTKCYIVSDVLKDTITFKNIAVLSFSMNTDGIRNRFLGYFPQDTTNQLSVVTSDGDIIYTNSPLNNTTKFEYLTELKQNSRSAIMLGGRDNAYLSAYSNNDVGIVIAAVTPRKELVRNANMIIQVILIVCVVAVFSFPWFAYIVSRLFSRRMDAIRSSITKIKNGDFSERIALGKAYDEITEISMSLNTMSAELEEFVQKEYVSQIQKANIDLVLKNTELKNLQAQIDPHFLYNTLEAIRMKANLSGAREAGDMIMILSKLFRNSIKASPIISIDEEIQTAKLYLKLFELKYSNISINFAVDDSILDFGIIRHVLQPVLENSVLHGFRNDAQNIITVRGWLREPYILLQLSDNGKGIDSVALDCIHQDIEAPSGSDSGSIGLSNVNERIKLVFGSECRLSIESQDGQGTTVTIKILAESVEELKKRV